jgi:hypothetical protein
MKKSVIVVVMLTVMALVGLAVVAQAAWYTCTIDEVGSTGSAYFVIATDTNTNSPYFTKVQFVIDEVNGRGKEMYAAALTAFANSTNLKIFITDNVDYTTIWGAYAVK